MSCCTACVHGGPCVSYATRAEQANAHGRLILADAADPDVRALARSIAADLGPDPQGYSAAEASAVHAYLRRHVRYVAEHDEVWTRTMDLLRLGAGDCDDLAGAAAALLASLGWTVALAYADGHVWTIGVSPTGDVRHVDATLDIVPATGAPPTETEPDVYVIRGTGAPSGPGATLATGAPPIAGPCDWSGDVRDVPRDQLKDCVHAEWGLSDRSVEAALEIGRRAWEGHGASSGWRDVSLADPAALENSWGNKFINKHGCSPIVAGLEALEAIAGASDVTKALRAAIEFVCGSGAHAPDVAVPEGEPYVYPTPAMGASLAQAIQADVTAYGLIPDGAGGYTTADGHTVWWSTDPPHDAYVWQAGEYRPMAVAASAGATPGVLTWLEGAPPSSGGSSSSGATPAETTARVAVGGAVGLGLLWALARALGG